MFFEHILLCFIVTIKFIATLKPRSRVTFRCIWMEIFCALDVLFLVGGRFLMLAVSITASYTPSIRLFIQMWCITFLHLKMVHFHITLIIMILS